MNKDNEILTIEEAAEYIRLGKRTIYKLIKMNEFPHGAPQINPGAI